MDEPYYPEPMSRKKFIDLHGGPPLVISRGDTTTYCADGARVAHNGYNILFHLPPGNEQDRLFNRVRYVKKLLHLTEQQLRNLKTAQQDTMSSGCIRYQMQNLTWDRELFGAPPLDQRGQLDFSVAIENLQSDISVLRQRFESLRDRLQIVNPRLIVDDRFIAC